MIAGIAGAAVAAIVLPVTVLWVAGRVGAAARVVLERIAPEIDED